MMLLPAKLMWLQNKQPRPISGWWLQDSISYHSLPQPRVFRRRIAEAELHPGLLIREKMGAFLCFRFHSTLCVKGEGDHGLLCS